MGKNPLRLAGGTQATTATAEQVRQGFQGEAPEEITKATVSRLASLPATGQDKYIQDAEVPGFKLRRDRNGRITFVFVGRVRGGVGGAKNKLINRTLGLAHGKGAITVAAARSKAVTLRAKLAEGIDPKAEQQAKQELLNAAAGRRKQQQQQDKWTVEFALGDFLEDRAARLDPADRLRPETVRYYRNSLGYLRGLARIPVAKLTTAEVRAALRQVPTVATQAKARRALSGVCGLAIRRLELNIINPVSRLDKGEFSAPDKRTGYLTAALLPEFVEKVLAISFVDKKGQPIKVREAERARDYILLVMLLGCRKQELMRMQWDWINWEADTLTIPATVTKNGVAHMLPLTDWTRGLLQARWSTRRPDAVYVFPGNVRGKPLSSVRDAFEQAAGSGVKLHDLRRTLSTHCENLGITGKRLKAILNHADAGVTEGYVQKDLPQMRRDLTTYHEWIAEECYWHGHRKAFPDAEREASVGAPPEPKREWPGVVR